MNKWNYIRLISAYGDKYGYNYGIYDLLTWCNKNGTIDVTEDEAKSYFELIKSIEAESLQKKRGFSCNRKALEENDFIYLGGR